MVEVRGQWSLSCILWTFCGILRPMVAEQDVLLCHVTVCLNSRLSALAAGGSISVGRWGTVHHVARLSCPRQGL